MKKQFYLLFVILFSALSFSSCDSKKDSPNKEESPIKKESSIGKLFSSEKSLKEGLIGKDFVSKDYRCLIDFRRENRFKIFVKETPNSEWIQFDGKKYRITTDSNDEVCIEFDYLEQNDGDNNAKGKFTYNEFTLTYFNGKTLKFHDFKIVTADEGQTIYENGSL